MMRLPKHLLKLAEYADPKSVRAKKSPVKRAPVPAPEACAKDEMPLTFGRCAIDPETSHRP